MRVNAETRAETRQRILDASRQLFSADGYDSATTRDIAAAAGIANGTLFNYFTSKETILAALIAEALGGLHSRFEHQAAGASLEEDLFAFVAAGLRKLKPWRKQLPALFGVTLNPLVRESDEEARTIRVSHLETVARLARVHGHSDLSALQTHLYWTLYVGVLMFWAADRSPRQEETLALLDESLSMFVNWLYREENPVKGGD